MNRFEYRVWDTKEQAMITGENVLKHFARYVQEERYILMESIGYPDKNGELIFEGDYLAEVWHNVKGVCTYVIKEIMYHEKNRCLGERKRKHRVVYHDRWQNDGFEKEMIFSLSPSRYEKEYAIIGNRYEHPGAIERFRPNYKDITQTTGWVDKYGKEIYEYHALLLPDGKHRVVEFNTKYRNNKNKFFLRQFENPWSDRFTDDLLTEERAKECIILTHTFLDEQKNKVKSSTF